MTEFEWVLAVLLSFLWAVSIYVVAHFLVKYW
jgi:hypothetical protein